MRREALLTMDVKLFGKSFIAHLADIDVLSIQVSVR